MSSRTIVRLMSAVLVAASALIGLASTEPASADKGFVFRELPREICRLVHPAGPVDAEGNPPEPVLVCKLEGSVSVSGPGPADVGVARSDAARAIDTATIPPDQAKLCPPT